MQAGDPLDFDFTEEEVYRALRLEVPEAEARRQAAAFAAAYEPGMDWAASEDTLLYLSLGSEAGRARVDRIRHSMQADRRERWLQHQRQQGAPDSPEELMRRWGEVLAADDRNWMRRIAELRRRLEEEGKLGGGPE